MKRIILIGALLAIVVISSTLFAVTRPKKLAITITPAVDSLQINGNKLHYQPGMKIDYNKPLTIRIEQAGYTPHIQALDPKRDNIAELTITLSPLQGVKPADAAPSQNASTQPTEQAQATLLAAAQSSNSDALLTSGGSLNVDIETNQIFNHGEYIVDVVKLHSPDDSDAALVVLKKDGAGYKIILGPGTHFDQADVKAAGLPTEVTTFIGALGYGQ